jgi:G6PDH family F420-dependent oxidoreductase
MLEESVTLMRELWKGEFTDHHGMYYTVEDARIYTLPAQPPPVYVSGFGPKAAALAGRIGDGYVTIAPDPDLIKAFRDAGGGSKPVQAGYKVCWGPSKDACVDIAHKTWPNEALPGELAQTLYSPRQFEQVSSLVTKEMIADKIACGPDLDDHLAAFKPFADAGIDVVHVSQIGAGRPESSAEGFFRVLPRRGLTSASRDRLKVSWPGLARWRL